MHPANRVSQVEQKGRAEGKMDKANRVSQVEQKGRAEGRRNEMETVTAKRAGDS